MTREIFKFKMGAMFASGVFGELAKQMYRHQFFEFKIEDRFCQCERPKLNAELYCIKCHKCSRKFTKNKENYIIVIILSHGGLNTCDDEGDNIHDYSKG